MENLIQTIRSRLQDQGACLVGFATISDLPEEARGSFTQAISIATPLAPMIVQDLKEGPTVAYYREYQRLNQELWRLAQTASRLLEAAGYETHAHKATSEHTKFDRDTLSVPLSHKAVALRAGLGWIGKSDLLITPEFGPAIRLTSVLHNAPLKTAEPVTTSRCGDCTQCVTSCPAQALTGQNWQAGMVREELYDAQACYTQARDFCAKIKLDATLCGICIHVCPYTQTYVKQSGGV